MKKNYKLIIQYDGSRYYGWEHQPNQDTIQGRLEKAVFALCNDNPDVTGAGRTDAGVHAKGMVANLFLDVDYAPSQIRRILNENLPSDIRVIDVKVASDNFHARYSAVGKTYQYTCHYGEVKSVFDRKYILELDAMPNVMHMKKAAEFMLGKHDFAAFCKLSEGYKSTVRVVDRIDIDCQGAYIRFTFHGTGFMRNMVRILVGTLLEVGYGKIETDDIPKIITAKERTGAGYTVAAQGLCLIEVDY